MANDNKKINDLVSESDDDTSELEVLSEDALNETDVEFEADAATHAFATLAQDRSDNDSIAALRSELRERDSNIDRLEFELQQFRSRAKGLEKELEAREALTRNLADELQQQKKIAGEVRERLQARERRLAELETTLKERDDRIGDTERELRSARSRAQSATTAGEELEKRHAADLRDMESLKGALAEEQSRRRWAEDAEQALGDKVAVFEEQQRESNELIASLRDYIEGRKSRWEQQASELETRELTLRNQHKHIERLTEDVRHAIGRLDQEKSAREQAVTRVAALENETAEMRGTIEALNEAIAEKDAGMAASRSEVDQLRATLEGKSSGLQRAEGELAAARSQLEEAQSAVASLRGELSSLRDGTGEREALLVERQQAISKLETHVSAMESRLEEARASRATLESRLEQERAARLDLEVEHEEMASETSRLRAEVEEQRAAAAGYAELERSQSQLVGQVASQQAVVEELRQQLTKTEGYADTLRDKLQRQIAEAEGQSSRKARLEENLAGASARIEQLISELKREKRQKSELAAELEKTRKDFEEEIRRIRFELDEAQETAAESKSVNEQLHADLLESTGYRRTLESKLSEFDESHRAELQARIDEVARLKLQLEDYEQKLAHKDAAVKALLAEFASKPKGAGVRRERPAADHDMTDVIHRLPPRRGGGDKAGDDTAGDRDRVTRLLVGTIDGQKLRFPLFKDKLTIGRTTHNDIQIKAQYISRRHAVVITEDEQTRIVDWGSRNGVYVNGIRVTEKALRNGDLVTVGTAEFLFEERPKR